MMESLRVDKIFASRWLHCGANLPSSEIMPNSQRRHESKNVAACSRKISDVRQAEGCGMQYLVKWIDCAYRDVCWVTFTQLIGMHEAETKLVNFHKRNGVEYLRHFASQWFQENFLESWELEDESSILEKWFSNADFVKDFQESGGWKIARAEITLSNYDEGNILLFSYPEKVIGMRKMGASKKGKAAEGEYLVKWRLLPYSFCTWEQEGVLRHGRFIEADMTSQEKIHYRLYWDDVSRLRWQRDDVDCIDAFHNRNLRRRFPKSISKKPQGAAESICESFFRKIDDDRVYLPTCCARRQLMPHQIEGVCWLLNRYGSGKRGSFLADEMGLGKTCQTIIAMEHILDCVSLKGVPSHGLIIVQKSVAENWMREFAMWAPHLNVVNFSGSREDREILVQWEKNYQQLTDSPTPTQSRRKYAIKTFKPDVVVATYESVRTTEFRSFFPTKAFCACLVVDECQKFKSLKSCLARDFVNAIERQYTILLSGTPVQNNASELFPLLAMVDPQRFSFKPVSKSRLPVEWSEDRFMQRFAEIDLKEDCLQAAQELKSILHDYVLRREKISTLRNLPSKCVKVVKIPLSLIQKRAYAMIYHKSIQHRSLAMGNMHLQLRKVCVHPFLVSGLQDMIIQGKLSDNDDSTYRLDLKQKYQALLIAASGKFSFLEKTLLNFFSKKRKVLVYSYFKGALDLVEKLVSAHDWLFERVDGDVDYSERQLAIDRFNCDPNRFVFLCTTRAGGLGINLTAASVVIHLDSDLNPQHDLQAQARCHRIGQDRIVDVFHLIAQHTYEDFVYCSIAGRKLGLGAVLLNDTNFLAAIRNHKGVEETLLRKGVFAALRDDSQSIKESEWFAKASMEEILKSSAVQQLDADEKSNGLKVVGNSNVSVLSSGGPSTTSRGSSSSSSSEVDARISTVTYSNDTSNINDGVNTVGLNPDDEHFWIQVAERLKNVQPLEAESSVEATSASCRKRKTSVPIYSDDELSESDDDDYVDYESSTNSSSEHHQLDRATIGPATTTDVAASPGEVTCIILDDEPEPSRTAKRRRTAAPPPQPTVHSSSPSAPQRIGVSAVTVLSSEALSLPVPYNENEKQLRVLKMRYAYCVLVAMKEFKCISSWANDLREVDKYHRSRISISTGMPLASSHVPDQPALLRRYYEMLNQMWHNCMVKWTEALDTVRRIEYERAMEWTESPSSRANVGSIMKLLLQNIDNHEQKFEKEVLRVIANCESLRRTTAIPRDSSSLWKSNADVSLKQSNAVSGWRPFEDFTIKILFCNFSQMFAIHRYQSGFSVMRWPPPKNEVDWSLITMVLNYVSQILCAGSACVVRTIDSVFDHFYNDLDSRWNRSPFSSLELQIIMSALENGISLSKIATYLPGRNISILHQTTKIKKQQLPVASSPTTASSAATPPSMVTPPSSQISSTSSINLPQLINDKILLSKQINQQLTTVGIGTPLNTATADPPNAMQRIAEVVQRLNIDPEDLADFLTTMSSTRIFKMLVNQTADSRSNSSSPPATSTQQQSIFRKQSQSPQKPRPRKHSSLNSTADPEIYQLLTAPPPPANSFPTPSMRTVVAQSQPPLASQIEWQSSFPR